MPDNRLRVLHLSLVPTSKNQVVVLKVARILAPWVSKVCPSLLPKSRIMCAKKVGIHFLGFGKADYIN